MPVLPSAGFRFAELPGRSSANPLPEGVPTGSSLRVVRIAPGPRTPHLHPSSAELVYVAEGEGTAWEDDVGTPISVGDVVVVPAGVPHATVAIGDSDLVLVCFFPHPHLAGNLKELSGPVRS